MVVGAYHTDVPDFLFPKNSVGISETVMARRKSIPWVYEGIRSLDDQHLAIVDGYTFGRDFQGADLDKYLDDKNNKVIKLHGDDALIRALGMIRKGLLDGVLDDRNVLTSKIIELGLDRDITVSNTISATEKIYVAFSPQLALSPERIKIFDEGLLRLRSSGALDKILHRYGLVDQ
jgi:polar amino acid transport system substrate-binding protein